MCVRGTDDKTMKVSLESKFKIIHNLEKELLLLLSSIIIIIRIIRSIKENNVFPASVYPVVSEIIENK